MTYTVPPLPADPDPEYIVVRNPDEIVAIQVNDLRAPRGKFHEPLGEWVAERDSLAQYRKSKEFDVRAKFPEPRK